MIEIELWKLIATALVIFLWGFGIGVIVWMLVNDKIEREEKTKQERQQQEQLDVIRQLNRSILDLKTEIEHIKADCDYLLKTSNQDRNDRYN